MGGEVRRVTRMRNRAGRGYHPTATSRQVRGFIPAPERLIFDDLLPWVVAKRLVWAQNGATRARADAALPHRREPRPLFLRLWEPLVSDYRHAGQTLGPHRPGICPANQRLAPIAGGSQRAQGWQAPLHWPSRGPPRRTDCSGLTSARLLVTSTKVTSATRSDSVTAIEWAAGIRVRDVVGVGPPTAPLGRRSHRPFGGPRTIVQCRREPRHGPTVWTAARAYRWPGPGRRLPAYQPFRLCEA